MLVNAGEGSPRPGLAAPGTPAQKVGGVSGVWGFGDSDVREVLGEMSMKGNSTSTGRARMRMYMRAAVVAAVVCGVSFVVITKGCVTRIPTKNAFDYQKRVVASSTRHSAIHWNIQVSRVTDEVEAQLLLEESKLAATDPFDYYRHPESVPRSLADRAWQTKPPVWGYYRRAHGLLSPWIICTEVNGKFSLSDLWVHPLGMLAEVSGLFACASMGLWGVHKLASFRRRDPALCAACGYQVVVGENVLARCPECGTETAPGGRV